MPNVAYDIKDVWQRKKEAALCHVSQQDVLKTFYLVPTGEDSSHFNAFDREYYYLWRQ
jgi:LmbE family N-acetylglucosaminyl deacetylase